MPTTTTLTARFEPGQDRTFQHIPFEVPAGVNQMHVSVNYNDRIDSNPMLTDGNTLDIGIFDHMGTDSGGPGLRGWSGSVRTEITIDESWAAPPYRAGDIEAGEWTILFGAYKIGHNGLDAAITITFGTDHQPPEIPPVPELAELKRTSVTPAAEPGWYRGDLHMHTVYSDGDSYPHEVAGAAYSAGLDFFGITDHNRAQSPVGLVPQGDGWPVLVPGVEVTTYAGHFNVWGTEGWYDFRQPNPEGLSASIETALAEGGLVSLNHPKPFGPPWEFPDVDGFHAIETWNGWWGRLNNISIGHWADALNEGSPDQWHVGIGGSDMHKNRTRGTADNPLSQATIGYPTLWIQTDEPLSSDTILAAIRAGNCFVSESPSGPQIFVGRDGDTVSAHVVSARGDALMVVGPHGCVAAEAITGQDVHFTWPADDIREPGAAYVRFEVHTATGGLRALSNPIWF